MKFIIQKDIPENAYTLTDLQKKYLLKVLSELDDEWDAEELQKQLYLWAKKLNLSSNEAFRALYIPLLGKDYGPRAAWLILKEDRNFINKYVAKKIYGKPVPVPYDEVFTKEDFIKKKERCFYRKNNSS